MKGKTGFFKQFERPGLVVKVNETGIGTTKILAFFYKIFHADRKSSYYQRSLLGFLREKHIFMRYQTGFTNQRMCYKIKIYKFQFKMVKI